MLNSPQKRPSRFDRKYFFPDPDKEQRTAYAHFWQRKLSDNDDIAFPDELCGAIADITDEFSFAYMQEAFVASLLAIARQENKVGSTPAVSDDLTEDLGDDDWVGVVSNRRLDGDLEDLVLWKEMQRQVKILR